MKTVTATFNGKKYTLPANNSGWISVSEVELPEGVTAEFLKNRERVGVGPKNEPIIQDDTGKKIHLGSAVFRREGESIKQGGGSGNGGSAKMPAIPEDVARRTVAIKNLPKELKEFYQKIVDEYDAQKAKKVDAAVAALMAIGYTEEEAKKLAKK